MARNCKIYTKDDNGCSINSTVTSSEYSGTRATPKNTDDVAKLISDPNGQGNGIGLNRESDTPEFRASLIQNNVAITARNANGKQVILKINCNKNLVSEIVDIFNVIYNTTDFRVLSVGCYDERRAKNPDGSDKKSVSNHAYGIAIDINGGSVGHNPYGTKYKSKCGICKKDNITDDNLHIRTENHPVVKIFKNHNWYWGGAFNDYMHFSKIFG